MKQKSSPLNIIWLFMIVAATVAAAYNGRMEAISGGMFDAAKSAVTLAIGWVGAMALWLGVMKVMEHAGAMQLIARAIRPLMKRLFPDVPPDHPAMSAMILNFAANALGLGNAATPLGIKAIKELDQLNPEKGTATNAMCLFLAINTSSVTILPLGAIAIRAGAGADNPAKILVPSILATLMSTTTAILAAKLLAAKSRPVAAPATQLGEISADGGVEYETPGLKRDDPPGIIGQIVMWTLVAAFAGAVVMRLVSNGSAATLSADFFSALSHWLMPVILCTFVLFGYFRGVKVYESLVEGAKEGFDIAVRIIPYLVAIFVAIGMFRESGALDIVKSIISPVTSLIGMPEEAVPMALIRPLSGSGAFGLMSEIVNRAPNSFLAFLVSTMQGSTETTFYVLAVYFGAVGVFRTRHAVPAALTADVVGALAALLVCRLMW
ncbi:MAG: spore maturation protein [Chitinivibrionales bacterium]|nr:spore maturation protein [Chitinivibrionales bacterium]MBD3357545.1 spore maturation protein [Chitinivibrionales bacterium]